MHEVRSRIATAADMAAITESSMASDGDLEVRDNSYLLRQTAVFALPARSEAVHPGDDSGCQLNARDRR